MRIHPEGRQMLLMLGLGLGIIVFLVAWLLPGFWLPPVLIGAVFFFLIVLQFFRNPVRTLPAVDNSLVYAPADGKVVVIEEAFEPEYLKDRRIQVSVFMSPINVHVNRNPVAGEVTYTAYHPGKYLVAWHPKSSTENERTTVVIDAGGTEILLRQIAGAVAKRIKNYLTTGTHVEQGSEMGFIKFGSRVDIFLPLDADIQVSIGDKVRGNETVLARLKE
ncbi:MAG: phosphatidylserine decarboxylase family protein [Saprospiraceae bacterium]